MAGRSLRVVVALLGLAAGACNNVTTLPDTQLRAPGGSLHDGGLGLGSGGVTPPAPGDSVTNTATTTTATSTTCVDLGGLGLGSGGRCEP